MADRTARRSAELAVASHVAGDAADDGALDASLGLRRREGGECQQANRGVPRSQWSDGSSPWRRACSVRSDFAELATTPWRSQRPCGHDSATKDFDDAKLIRKFGDVPDDLSAL